MASRWRRIAGRAVALALTALVATGCDPGHPFVDLHVTVFSEGDGTAEVGVRVRPPEGLDVDEAEVAAAMVEALDIGRAKPVGPERRTFEVDGVNEDRIAVAVDDVLAVAQRFGFPATSSSFVSVCAPAEAGRASGVGVSVGRYSSCATWTSYGVGVSTSAVAVVEFGSHRAPWFTWAVWAGLLAALALAGGVVGARIAAPSAVRVLALVWACACSLGLGGLGLLSVYSGLTYDTFFGTGQDFDHHVRSGYFRTGLVAMVGGVVLITLIAAANARSRGQSQQRQKGWPAGSR